MVFFLDFKDFSWIFKDFFFVELVEVFDCCFKVFDEIVEVYGIEKIKIIGDVYMAVVGVLEFNLDDVYCVVQAVFVMQDWLE